MSLNIFPLKTVTRQRESTSCLLVYANNNRNQGRFNDITIQSADISIAANRMVLSCYCLFFNQIFAIETMIKSMIQLLTFQILMENCWNSSFNTFTLVK